MIGAAPVSSALGAANGVFAFAVRHRKAIAVGAALAGLAVALLLARATLAGARRDLATARTALAGERAAHEVTRAGVDSLQAAIARQNAAITERSAALERARAQAAADVAAADERWRGTANQVDRLRALAKGAAGPGCAAPAVLLKALEGL